MEMQYIERRVFNREENTLDMANRRATDMPNNRKVWIPKARPPKEEAELNLRAEIWMREVDKYIE